jgi:sialic acid synthase SpsE
MPESLLKPDGVTIVAEVSCSHGGQLHNAYRLIDEAKRARADSIKLQLFEVDDMVGVGRNPILTAGPWKDRGLRDLYEQTRTPRLWFPELFAYARSLGLVPFSSVLSLEGVDYLETLGCCAYKIPSAEIGWLELIQKASDTEKLVLLSTGMATPREIGNAAAHVPGWKRLWLHCVAAYPADVQSMHLSTLKGMRGLSDHSKSLIPPIVATAYGARVIEKHIQLPNVVTPDSGFALTPAEFAAMVEAVRDTEAAMREPTEDVEQESRQWKRRLIDGQWLRG